ncbi:hypothetical protein SD70_13485 [Gordoniibacillus kamchatkensis]|uniref:Periplasmic binding protein domain-containing protein n=1 Tax=Gordoniibacillus kamchatkensis TaxID=1590651 RepID=A0ABR5AH88_9BACL|nr:ABC transporter substrate-binding protein [Paenibacillus sp. VKM B-2647]KIL40425.1 hypothetical protein SD70_13485 [Paenibacillus sp. VKM B-2647]
MRGGLAGCTGTGGKDRVRQIAVVSKDFPSDYWKSVRSGAQAAADEFGLKLVYMTAGEYSDPLRQQQEYMSEAIASQVDGILLAPADYSGLAAKLQEARSRRIPVVTMDAQTESTYPVSHVATDNVRSAAIAAGFMQQSGASGKVLIVRSGSDSFTEDARISGFKKGLDGTKLVISETLSVPSGNLAAMQTAVAYLRGHTDISGIFATCSECAAGAGLAVREIGLTDRIVCIGFDSSQDEIRLLEEGVLQAIVVQNPFAMGYFGVKAVADTLSGIKVQPLIETKAEIVTKETIKLPEYQKLIYPFDK